MNPDRLKMIREMLEKNPDDSFLNYAAALEFRKNGETVRAAEMIERLIMKDADYLAAYYQLGKMYESLDKHDKAITIYKKGVSVARQQNNSKTVAELNEALLVLDEDPE